MRRSRHDRPADGAAGSAASAGWIKVINIPLAIPAAWPLFGRRRQQLTKAGKDRRQVAGGHANDGRNNGQQLGHCAAGSRRARVGRSGGDLGPLGGAHLLDALLFCPSGVVATSHPLPSPCTFPPPLPPHTTQPGRGRGQTIHRVRSASQHVTHRQARCTTSGPPTQH